MYFLTDANYNVTAVVRKEGGLFARHRERLLRIERNGPSPTGVNRGGKQVAERVLFVCVAQPTRLQPTSRACFPKG